MNRGKFDERPVAVKRLLPECFGFADREVSSDVCLGCVYARNHYSVSSWSGWSAETVRQTCQCCQVLLHGKQQQQQQQVVYRMMKKNCGGWWILRLCRNKMHHSGTSRWSLLRPPYIRWVQRSIVYTFTRHEKYLLMFSFSRHIILVCTWRRNQYCHFSWFIICVCYAECLWCVWAVVQW